MDYIESDEDETAASNDALDMKLTALEASQVDLSQQVHKLIRTNEDLKHENLTLRQSLIEYKNACHLLHKELGHNHQRTLILEKRLLNVEKSTHDGTFLWKITHFDEKYAEAVAGRQASLYSPVFYTSREGFCVCSKVYLFGDGCGHKTHMSLFFVILRGEFDAVLAWPFRHQVTFTLVDQEDAGRNYKDAFTPDPTSDSFSRPHAESNKPAGIPQFFPLSKLKSSDKKFVKDNTLYIKIVVDTCDLSFKKCKTVWMGRGDFCLKHIVK